MNYFLSKFIFIFLLILLPTIGSALDKKSNNNIVYLAAPKTTTTFHQIVVNGKPLKYEATIGVIPIRDDKGKRIATMSYIAFNKLGIKDYKKRPLSFLYNGGPGYSSTDLNFLATGPYIAKLDKEGRALSMPGHLVKNSHTWLQFTDEVYVDMVGSGWGRTHNEKTEKQFLTAKKDIQSFGDFIHTYLQKNNRWQSPLFLVGESYGGFRTPLIAEYLLLKYSLPTSGLIFISPLLDYRAMVPYFGHNLLYVLSLPTFTATALYYHKLKHNLQEHALNTIHDAERWAVYDYWPALFHSESLTTNEQKMLLKNLEKYTGLPANIIKKNYYRISPNIFREELLSNKHLTLGKLDTRFTQHEIVSEENMFSFLSYAMLSTIETSPYPAIMHYLQHDLGAKTNLPYFKSIPAGKNWEWLEKDALKYPELPEVLSTLHDVMVANPFTKVFIASGYYDLGIPYYFQIYGINQLQLMPNIRKNITNRVYFSGHMMYIDHSVRAKLYHDIAQFYSKIRSA